MIAQLSFGGTKVFRSINVHLWLLRGTSPIHPVHRCSTSDSTAANASRKHFQTFVTNAYLNWIVCWGTRYSLVPNMCDALSLPSSVLQPHGLSSGRWSDRSVTSAMIIEFNVNFTVISLFISRKLNTKLVMITHFASRCTANIILALVPFSLFPQTWYPPFR